MHLNVVGTNALEKQNPHPTLSLRTCKIFHQRIKYRCKQQFAPMLTFLLR
jgi:hypothetical protein